MQEKYCYNKGKIVSSAIKQVLPARSVHCVIKAAFCLCLCEDSPGNIYSFIRFRLKIQLSQVKTIVECSLHGSGVFKKNVNRLCVYIVMKVPDI